MWNIHIHPTWEKPRIKNLYAVAKSPCGRPGGRPSLLISIIVSRVGWVSTCFETCSKVLSFITLPGTEPLLRPSWDLDEPCRHLVGDPWRMCKKSWYLIRFVYLRPSWDPLETFLRPSWDPPQVLIFATLSGIGTVLRPSWSSRNAAKQRY